jgi:hypothetical protein
MGDFRVVVEATGGHGCQREVGDGGQVFGCRMMTCPDCLTMEFVEKMKKIATVKSAQFVHWPNAADWGATPIIDEIHGPSVDIASYKTSGGEDRQYVNQTPVHRIRRGSFSK